jgi:hypothetical protein
MKMAVALIMESASTSESSVNFYQTTQRNNPENSHLHFLLEVMGRILKLNTTRGTDPYGQSSKW